MEILQIPVILATAREGRRSEDAAEFIFDYLKDDDELEPELIDVRDYLFGRTYEAWNEHEEVPKIKEWKEKADEADAFIIVTPEYNRGYPGELKIFLDAAFQEYFDKPTLLAGVSSGRFGGARVVDLIKPTLIELGMTPMGRALYFPNAGDLFVDDGSMTADQIEDYKERIDDAVEPLKNYARHFQGIREDKGS